MRQASPPENEERIAGVKNRIDRAEATDWARFGERRRTILDDPIEQFFRQDIQP